MEIQFNIARLISKSFAQTITTSEKEELKVWLDRDKNNQALFEKILKEKHLNKNIENLKKYDIRSELKDIHQKIRVNHPKRINISQILRYAAVIILPITLAAYLYFIGLPESLLNTEPITINPGTSKALLITDSNQSYHLGNDTVFSIQDSLVKIKSTGNALIYTKSEHKSRINKREVIHRLIVPRGGEKYVEFSDGSRMWVNSASEITYPKEFIGKQRNIEVIKGEIYLEVAHNAERPFFVKSQKGIVEVLGTSFNIRAYEDEENNITTLVEGSIKIQHRFDDQSALVLAPGQQASIKSVNHRIKVKNVNTSHYTAWKDNRFEFHKEPLDYIMKSISRWYDIDIYFIDEEVKRYSFSARLDKYDEVNKLIEKIELTKKVKIKITKKGIEISKYN